MTDTGGAARVGVVGAGVMGAEIALVAAGPGRDVVLVDVDDAALERGLAHATAAGRRMVARGRWEAADLDRRLAAIRTATGTAALAGCGLVIEAVPERLALKRAVLAEVAAAVGPEAIVATNTSGLSITDLAASAAPPGRVVGLHFFNPPSVMRLVEVIRGERTSEATAAAAAAFARDLGKTPVAVRECPGFVVNRVLVRAMAAAYRASAAAGLTPADADAAVVAAGPSPMGPHALGDLIGLDTLEAIRADLARAYGDRFDDGGALAAQVASGRLGRKTGGGFLGPRPEAAAAPGPAAGPVGEAYHAAALDEARRVRDEGIASAADIDLAMVLGAGWASGPLAEEG